MPRIFLYEFVTGGGFLGDPAGRLPPASLLCEGGAMRAALATDLAAIEGVEVCVVQDCRLALQTAYETSACPPSIRLEAIRSVAEERAAFDRLAAESDWTVVIAPELENHLLRRCQRVQAVGGRLLGPGPALVELASDKHATAEHLAQAGVPVPEGSAVEPGQPVLPPLAYPAVGKPRWGAGSQGVRLLPDAQAAARWLAEITEPSRIEQFSMGLAASVSFLCGPSGISPLPPCRQHLSDDGRFAYLGGSLPLPEPLARRAVELATRAVVTLPNPIGYLGVDLVLGEEPSGAGDAVIEINPRLTTSYAGLRAAAAEGVNLASALLAVCKGGSPRLSFRPVWLQFGPTGTIA